MLQRCSLQVYFMIYSSIQVFTWKKLVIEKFHTMLWISCHFIGSLFYISEKKTQLDLIFNLVILTKVPWFKFLYTYLFLSSQMITFLLTAEHTHVQGKRERERERERASTERGKNCQWYFFRQCSAFILIFKYINSLPLISLCKATNFFCVCTCTHTFTALF